MVSFSTVNNPDMMMALVCLGMDSLVKTVPYMYTMMFAREEREKVWG
jgi:hypothetical protein